MRTATGTKTVAVYADTRKRGCCRGPSCHARIEWATVVGTNKAMCFTGSPLTLNAFVDGNGRQIDLLPLDANHWKDCPDAARFKRAKAAAR